MPSAIIFDMDGVLVDSYRPHLESWVRLAKENGLSLTEPEFASTFGRTSREILREMFGLHDPEAIVRLDARKETIYRDLIRGRVPAMRGLRPTLEGLREAGYLLAVGSSGPPENVRLVISELSLDRWFKVVITGGDVRKGKPDPEVFLLAATKLGVSPSDCVVVEDAPAGIEAAHRAGMKAIALAGTHQADSLRGADLVITRLSDLTPQMATRLLRGHAISGDVD